MSLLIKDTTREEREQIIRQSVDCGGGCESCRSLADNYSRQLLHPYREQL